MSDRFFMNPTRTTELYAIRANRSEDDDRCRYVWHDVNGWEVEGKYPWLAYLGNEKDCREIIANNNFINPKLVRVVMTEELER